MTNLKDKIQSLTFISDYVKEKIDAEVDSLSPVDQTKLTALLDSYEKDESAFAERLSKDLRKMAGNNMKEIVEKINKSIHLAKKEIENARLNELKKTLSGLKS